MEVSGLCSICGKLAKPAHSCRFCGAIVCSEHYDASSGLCSNCKSRIKRGR